MDTLSNLVGALRSTFSNTQLYTMSFGLQFKGEKNEGLNEMGTICLYKTIPDLARRWRLIPDPEVSQQYTFVAFDQINLVRAC